MKKSELRKLVLEVMQGYSKYYAGGKTPGLTPDVFNSILKNIALGKRNSEEDDSEEERAKRGNAILDKANPENVDRILRGEKPIYEGENDLYSKEEAIDYIENNPSAKYYKIGVSKGVSRTLQNVEQAIETLKQSSISEFELSIYGQVIQFSAPYDEAHGAAVRAMGGLD